MKLLLSDATANAWLESPDEKHLKKVMLSLAAMLRNKGWSMWVPYDEHQEGRHGKAFDKRWAERFRKGIKNGLEIQLYICGRHLEIEMWENVNDHSKENQNGGKYIFDKESKMPYLLKVLTNLTKKHIHKHLEKHYDAIPGTPFKICEFKRKRALDSVFESIKNSCHYNPELGHARITCNNDKSRDGLKIEHGATVYFADWHGRILKGVAYYSLNANWYVVTGEWDYSIVSCHDIFVRNPGNLKVKRNERTARKRLEQELSKAIKVMDFDRAKTIKNILFDDEPLFHIMKGDLYYKPNSCGYTKNVIEAGKYTGNEIISHSRNKDLKIVPANH